MEMSVGLMYAIVAYFAVLISGMVFNRTKATKYKETVDRPFIAVLLFFILFSLVDGTWGLLYSRLILTSWSGYRLAYQILSYGFHTMSAVSAFVWTEYMIFYIRLGKKTQTVMHVISSVMLLAQVTILVSNAWTGLVFWFDEGDIYHTEFLRSVLFWIQFAYYALMAIVEVILIAKRKDEKLRSVCQRALVFSLIPVISGMAQRLFPDAPMYSFGFMASAVTIYAFNITAQRESYLSEMVKKENDRFSAVISGLSDDFRVIYHVDPVSGQYERFTAGKTYTENDVADNGTDFFGVGAEKIFRRAYPEDRELLESSLSRETIAEQLAEKSSFSFICRMEPVDWDGTTQIRYTLFKVIRYIKNGEEDGTFIIGAFDDDDRVTKELEQQQALNSALTQAESASRAKTNFLFNMSHDIRTPMNAILGFCNMARKNIGDNEKTKDCLDKVHTAGTHLLTIINDILDMSRIENDKVTLDPQPVSLCSCANDMLDLIEMQTKEKGILLKREGQYPENDCVLADVMCLKRVLSNILTNAVKYTQQGSITFRAAEIPAKEGMVGIAFTVEDTGIGMSEEYQEHIFETFSRERNSTTSGIQGTGLGMAITKSLVDLMEGTIAIESRLGVGTKITLRFSFPAVSDSETDENDAEKIDTSCLCGKKILLVEDNELNREIAQDLLCEFGITVDECTDGIYAVEYCSKLCGSDRAEKPDCILMDVQMPTMDGYTATEKIRNLEDPFFRSVPIIAMTANVFAEDVQHAKDAGMNAHLGKPIDVMALTKILLSLTDKT